MKKVKKLISAVVCMVMLCAVLPCVTVGAEELASGECGDNLTWTLTRDGVLTVSGTGNMSDYGVKGAPWYSWCNFIKSVVINEGVTSIGEYALYDFGKMKTLVIPVSVTHIGDKVFSMCFELESISVDKNNKYYASLDGALFDKNISRLIQFPCGVETDYTVPDSVTVIEDNAFASSLLTGITIPNGVKRIGDSAFCDSRNIKKVDIPGSMEYIGDYAFYECTSIEEVNIAEGITKVGAYAFYKCPIKKISIPASLKESGRNAFYSWGDYLTDVYYGGSEEEWNALDNDFRCDFYGATFHYNCNISAPEITNATVMIENNVVSVSVSTENVSSNNLLIAVGYGADGEYIDLAKVENDSAQLGKEVKTVKVFAWESLESMIPLCEAKEVTAW